MKRKTQRIDLTALSVDMLRATAEGKPSSYKMKNEMKINTTPI